MSKGAIMLNLGSGFDSILAVITEAFSAQIIEFIKGIFGGLAG
jgi:hypothetical protein